MSKVTGNFSLVVNPATTQNPLVMTPSSDALIAETEGVNDPGQKIAEVSGGTPPYTFSATGVPDGMDLTQQPDADGTGADVMLEGTPTVGDAAQSPFTIAITATDSATPAAQARARIAVRR